LDRVKKRTQILKRRIMVKGSWLVFAGGIFLSILVGWWNSLGRVQDLEPVLGPTLSPTNPLTMVVYPTLTPMPTVTSQPILVPTPAIQYLQALVTFYGWPDNDPAGRAIAYPKSRYESAYHDVAGGLGTYGDPITLASSADIMSVGTKVYVPYLKKYLVKEDWCESCGGSPLPHIDVWMESGEGFAAELQQCQYHFTRQSIPIEVDPPPGRLVETAPLFNRDTGECLD
jgi:3D (Asp-Asp-Asp) domain-containing protein